MRRFLWVVSVLLACSDPPADLPLDPPADPAPDPSFVWANPPNCAADAPPVSLAAARHDSLPDLPNVGPQTLDDAWYRLASHVPGGWAGLYLEPVNGRNTNVLMFVDTTNIQVALDSLVVYYPGSHRSFARDSVVLRLVRWNWVQLDDWYRYFNLVAGLPDGVSFTDIQELNNRLEFGAPTAADRELLLQRFQQLGAPCWLAAVTVVPLCDNGSCLKSVQPPPAASGIVAP